MNPFDTCLLTIFLVVIVLMMRSFLKTRSTMKENERLRAKIKDVRRQINAIYASQRNEKI